MPTEWYWTDEAIQGQIMYYQITFNVEDFKCINPQILDYRLVPKVIPFILENIELRLNISFIGI